LPAHEFGLLRLDTAIPRQTPPIWPLLTTVAGTVAFLAIALWRLGREEF